MTPLLTGAASTVLLVPADRVWTFGDQGTLERWIANNDIPEGNDDSPPGLNKAIQKNENANGSSPQKPTTLTVSTRSPSGWEVRSFVVHDITSGPLSGDLLKYLSYFGLKSMVCLGKRCILSRCTCSF